MSLGLSLNMVTEVCVAVAKKMRWKLYGFYRKLGRHIAGLLL